jgi:hypothetical protein
VEGDRPTASGAFALEANTSGAHDTADGAFALFRNTTGFENSVFGKAALFGNTTGSDNTASGLNAVYYGVYSGRDDEISMMTRSMLEVLLELAAVVLKIDSDTRICRSDCL